MGKNQKQAEKRRAHRTERRRVMLKQRKADDRARGREGPPNAGWAANPSGDVLRIGRRLLEALPIDLTALALQRNMKRMDAASTVAGLPPGFELRASPKAWQIVPPPEHDHWLIKAITHPAPELAMAFAWEVARREIDAEATIELARNVVASMIEQGCIATHGMEPEVTIKMLSTIVASELLTGYASTVAEFEGEIAPPPR